jgi:hypothetical protein
MGFRILTRYKVIYSQQEMNMQKKCSNSILNWSCANNRLA